MIEATVFRYHEIGPERTDEFLSKGYKYRHVFAHQFYYLPKGGPDGLRLAQSMCGPCQLNELWEIVLYAHPRLLAEFPEKLFFDDDLCWHQQQFGKPGQIATANLLWRGADLYSMVHQSDLVQRASRQPEYRTRLQNRFKGWNFMLLNAILNFAVEQNARFIYTPTAKLALRNTDPGRDVKSDLFARVYDQQVQQLFHASQAAEWWKISVEESQHRLIRPKRKVESLPKKKTICLCHDIESGLGHLDSNPGFAVLAEKTSPASLTEMLRIERRLGLKATYNIVGQLLPSVREQIASGGHCLAFHSYNHRNFEHEEQLRPCRNVDYRLKGYRPPQSKMTAELTDENLCYYNFEWLASSVPSLGISAPRMHNRLVKIPVAFDDYQLFRDGLSWESWENLALEEIRKNDFIAFSLHDCYAQFWLPHYERFLEKVCALGRLKTMNDVLNATLVSHAA